MIASLRLVVFKYLNACLMSLSVILHIIQPTLYTDQNGTSAGFFRRFSLQAVFLSEAFQGALASILLPLLPFLSIPGVWVVTRLVGAVELNERLVEAALRYHPSEDPVGAAEWVAISVRRSLAAEGLVPCPVEGPEEYVPVFFQSRSLVQAAREE